MLQRLDQSRICDWDYCFDVGVDITFLVETLAVIQGTEFAYQLGWRILWVDLYIYREGNAVADGLAAMGLGHPAQTTVPARVATLVGLDMSLQLESCISIIFSIIAAFIFTQAGIGYFITHIFQTFKTHVYHRVWAFETHLFFLIK